MVEHVERAAERHDQPQDHHETKKGFLDRSHAEATSPYPEARAGTPVGDSQDGSRAPHPQDSSIPRDEAASEAPKHSPPREAPASPAYEPAVSLHQYPTILTEETV